MALDASYEEVHGGRTHECKPWTVLFHAALEQHLERFGETGGRSAAFDGGLPRTIGTRLYREFLTADDGSGLTIEGLLFEISGELVRARERCAQKWLDDSATTSTPISSAASRWL